MTNERRVLVHSTKESLGASVAARFITKIIDVVEEQNYARPAVTSADEPAILTARNR